MLNFLVGLLGLALNRGLMLLCVGCVGVWGERVVG